MSLRRRLINSHHNNYITDGLIMHLDAINNTRLGHSVDSLIWEDLSDQGNDFTMAVANWGTNYYNFNGAQDGGISLKELDILTNNQITIEICQSLITGASGGIILENFPTSDLLTGGFFIIQNWRGGGFSKQATQSLRIYNGSAYHRIGYWHNYSEKTTAYVYNGDNFAQILDGIPSIFETKDSFNKTIARTKLCVGARNINSNRAKTNLHALRIYNRALSTNELLYNYQIDKNRFNL